MKTALRTLLLAALLLLGGSVTSASAALQAAFECTPSCTIAPGESVAFASTSRSSTPIRNHEWDLDGDGLHGAADDPDEPYGPTARQARRSFPDAGSYTVGLRVTNRDGEQSTATRTVIVSAPASPSPPPTAQDVPLQSLPTADDDGDGTANRRDLCPATPAGQRPALRGCALVEAIVAPAALHAWAAGSIGALGGPDTRWKAGLKTLKLATDRLAGNPCGASRMAGRGLQSLEQGADRFHVAVRRRQKTTVMKIGRLWQRRPTLAGDTNALDSRLSGLSAELEEAQDAIGDVTRLRRMFATACRRQVGSGQHKVSGRVVSVDSTHALATLANGTTLALGAAAGTSGLAPGVALEATGTEQAGDVLVTDSVKLKDLTLVKEVLPCSFSLRIAPVQSFSAQLDDIYYADPRGYLDESNRYVLEGGMGINATRSLNCDKYDDYRLSIFVDYRNAAGVKVIKKPIGWVRGTPDSDPPVRIPSDIHPSTQANTSAKLRFELWGYDCTDATLQYCAGVKLQSKFASPAHLRAQGRWGTAVYDRKWFSVEDGSKTDFEIATLKGVQIPPGTLPDPTVFGVGYGLSGGQSTFPATQFILDEQPFAVHDDVLAPDAEAYRDIDKAGLPGGLYWAYINGFRNGHPYHYVARLPEIVTDVVNFCPGKGEDSFYRLPWPAGHIHKVTQGNNTDFTHKDDPDTPTTDQKFAFDFRMPDATLGIAPRGGLVISVVENLKENSDPNVAKFISELTNGTVDAYKPANELRVRHQDGTISSYYHMRPNGVTPEEGDIIERGEPVIMVGNTGNSTGPHLHFHVTDKKDKGTVQIRFELGLVLNGTVGPPVPCLVPGENTWISTNEKPGS